MPPRGHSASPGPAQPSQSSLAVVRSGPDAHTENRLVALEARLDQMGSHSASFAEATEHKLSTLESAVMDVGARQGTLDEMMRQLAGSQLAMQRSVADLVGGFDSMRKDVASLVHPPPTGGGPDAARRRTDMA